MIGFAAAACAEYRYGGLLLAVFDILTCFVFLVRYLHLRVQRQRSESTVPAAFSIGALWMGVGLGGREGRGTQPGSKDYICYKSMPV
jgi:hypothetical protein